MRRIKRLLLGNIRSKYKTVIRNHKVKFKLVAMKVIAVKGEKNAAERG